MRRSYLSVLLSLSTLFLFTSACAEESATDVPDLRAEKPPGQGRVLEELVEVVPIPADAPPSPLVDGLVGLMTFEEAFEVVKNHSHFISQETMLEKRGVCPGLRTRLLEVASWNDLGMSGLLTLSFYNGILGSARFGTGDLERYKALVKKERGAAIRSVKRSRIEPYTDVWIPMLPPHAPTYDDERVGHWQDSITKACRYQMQIEDGVSPPIE